MKKTKRVMLATVICGLFAIMGLCACAAEVPPSPPPEDHIAPVIDGVMPARIDLTTDKFNIYEGVSVSDLDDDGNTFDLTASIKVVLPSDVTKSENGDVAFKKAGDYTFTYYVADSHGNATAVNRKIEVRNIYNLYWAGATLPVLYQTLDMVTNDYKSLIWVERAGTIDFDKLDEDRFIFKADGAGNAELAQAQAEVGKIASSDPYSYFRVFTVDARCGQELFTLQANGITLDRYEVKLTSDGSLTYGTIFSTFKSGNALQKWNTRKELYEKMTDKAVRGDFVSNDGVIYEISAPIKFGEGDTPSVAYYSDGKWKMTSDLWNSSLEQCALVAAQRDNVELWCAYPETLTTSDAALQVEFDKINMPKMDPVAMYKALTDEQRESFLQLVKFNKADFDETYFAEEGDYLIITGTSYVRGGSLTDEQFFDIIDRIISDNPDRKLLFKPHPAQIPSEINYPEIYAYFAEKNIKILPGRLPMEVISWVYSDVAIGGFDSSLFMAVPQNNVKFFISPGASSLTALSKILLADGVWGEPEFYWKA